MQFGNRGFVPPPVITTQECPHCGAHFTKYVYADGNVDTEVVPAPRLGVVG